ncbi:uncharacterized protein LOC111634047 [Centruroides sculpturatus]|uniref:uncharacterized protein LOC111634047 n=1 Tax=Centruroides sculpturatus TaxID=218467 RepID=UPI000C6C94DD|nr:uncharacterized protein LOC111634047 [Centruroides sculpturatus]
MTKLSINFHDVKNVIKPFDGSEYCSIDKWLVAFEDFAKMMTWSDLHKFIFAKQSLTGLAKLFVESQSGINSWDKLKSELKAEFGSKYNSARLHGMLAKRQMLPNESVQEYFFKMQELASRGKIEPDGLIEYVISGIRDIPSNKAMLYGTDNLTEFHEKLRVYEKIRSTYSRSFQSKPNLPTEHRKPQPYRNKRDSKTLKCFNCNEIGHISSNCSYKSEGIRCFKCKKFGHKANACPQKEVNKMELSHFSRCNNKIETDVEILGAKTKGLIDTGSDVTMIPRHFYDKVGTPKLNSDGASLIGLDGNSISPLGFFESEIKIDEYSLPANIYVVEGDLCNSIIIGIDVLNKLNFSITNYGFKVMGKRSQNTIRVNYTRIFVPDGKSAAESTLVRSDDASRKEQMFLSHFTEWGEGNGFQDTKSLGERPPLVVSDTNDFGRNKKEKFTSKSDTFPSKPCNESKKMQSSADMGGLNRFNHVSFTDDREYDLTDPSEDENEKTCFLGQLADATDCC